MDHLGALFQELVFGECKEIFINIFEKQFNSNIVIMICVNARIYFRSSSQ